MSRKTRSDRCLAADVRMIGISRRCKTAPAYLFHGRLRTQGVSRGVEVGALIQA